MVNEICKTDLFFVFSFFSFLFFLSFVQSDGVSGRVQLQPEAEIIREATDLEEIKLYSELLKINMCSSFVTIYSVF